MKIWNAYGSEHSANLVMIGHFKDSASAEETNGVITELREFAADSDNKQAAGRYSEAAMKLLEKFNFYSVGSGELEQFNYDYRVKVEGTKIIIETDEIEIAGLMKLMFVRGARVEIYSAHDEPDTPHGRGKG